jgi:hypothetical protein
LFGARALSWAKRCFGATTANNGAENGQPVCGGDKTLQMACLLGTSSEKFKVI